MGLQTEGSSKGVSRKRETEGASERWGGVTWEDSRPATPGDSKETLNKDTS